MSKDAGPYISSIIFNYGDMDNVRRDAKTVREILNRQGSRLLIEVMANAIGDMAIKFKLSSDDVARAYKSECELLRELVLERT